MLQQYIYLKVPRRKYSRDCREITYALLDPHGRYVAGSSGPSRQLQILRDKLNEAYELGYVTGRLSVRKFNG